MGKNGDPRSNRSNFQTMIANLDDQTKKIVPFPVPGLSMATEFALLHERRKEAIKKAACEKGEKYFEWRRIQIRDFVRVTMESLFGSDAGKGSEETLVAEMERRGVTLRASDTPGGPASKRLRCWSTERWRRHFG